MTLAETSLPLPRADSDRLRRAIDEHYDVLWRALRRFGVPEAHVEDSAQQALIVFSNRLADVPPGSERAFLYGTAVRVASDVRKRLARSREVSDEGVEQNASPAPNAEELVDARRARQLLDGVLEAMPMDLRTVFVLYELEEMTMAAIATALELPAGTVASRLRRARENFEASVRDLQTKGRTP
jgi:RNA polymerase sigma-70 factor (ECF subfamily)